MFIRAFVTAFFMLSFGAISHAYTNHDGLQFFANLLFNLVICGFAATIIAGIAVVVARYKDVKLL